MATRIQSAVANSGASTGTVATSVTLSSSPTAGNYLVLAASVNAGTVPALTDDPNVGWTIYLRTGASGSTAFIAVGQVFSGASATQTVTATAGIALVLAEYSGDDFVVDRVASATASSATCASGTTGTTSVANGLWVSAIGTRATGGATFSAPTNSFTIVDQTKTSLSTTSDRSVCLLEFFPSSTATASTGVTASGSGVYAGVIATLYEVTSGSSGGGMRLAGHGGLAA